MVSGTSSVRLSGGVAPTSVGDAYAIVAAAVLDEDEVVSALLG
jgi:hypothetical protein